MSQITVRILKRDDKNEFNNLSQLAFGQAAGFRAQARSISWSPVDEVFYPLGLFYENELASFMRIEWMNKIEDFQGRLKFTPRAHEIPCGYFNMAGTHPKWMKQGFNALLRYFGIKIVMHWQMRYLFGSMVPGSPRVETMKRLGYEFWSAQQNWNGGFESDHPPLIGRLNLLTRGSMALQILAQENSELLKRCQTKFQMSDFVIWSAEQASEKLMSYKSHFGSFEPTSL